MIVGVTGGTGFIGKSLILRHIQEGDDVRLLSRNLGHESKLSKSVKYYRGDLTGKSSDLIDFVDGIDILYHCAGEINNQGKMHDLHVTGTINLSEAASGKIGHWVQLSSVGVYGFHSGGIITEETPLNPVGIYEASKAESDQIVISTSQKGGFSYSILRPSNVYGPGMSNQSLFQMISMIKKRLFFFIGEPGAVMNYIHVDNVADALIRCGNLPAAKNRIYNLSDSCTIEHFVSIISDELNLPKPKLRLPEWPIRRVSSLFARAPWFPLTKTRVDALTVRARYSYSRICDELSYIHRITLDEGIRQFVGR